MGEVVQVSNLTVKIPSFAYCATTQALHTVQTFSTTISK